MLKAIAEPRKELSKYAPKIEMVQIPPEKIGEVVGSRGKVINRIIDESGVDKIDTEDDGKVFVASANAEAIKKAIDMIKIIALPLQIGAVFTGKVTRILDFGCFVEIAPEKEGLVRISQLDKQRVETVASVVSVGEEIKVKILEIDEKGRLNLSRKAAL